MLFFYNSSTNCEGQMTKKTCQIIIIFYILTSDVQTKKYKSFSKPDYNQDIIVVTKGMSDANLNFIRPQTKKALHYIILIFSATI